MTKIGAVTVRDSLIDWLLDGPPWVAYRTLVDLFGKKRNDHEVLAAREAVTKHPRIRKILDRQDRRGWWGDPGDIHKWWPRKDTTFWMLPVLADFGLTIDEPHLARAAECILDLQLPNGGFLGWQPSKAADCHTAILLQPLVQMGLGDDPRIGRAYDWLFSRQRLDGGWWCKDTAQPGGPREGEPSCPFATMFVLGALAQRPDLIDAKVSRRSVAFLLDCWTNRKRIKYPGHDSQIGSQWEKLKYPFIDYRILKFLEVLFYFPMAREDSRSDEMLKILQAKADGEGRFRPESIVKTWADFDFGQKKDPSRWMTVLAWGVLRRLGEKALKIENIPSHTT